jgi:SAM-dependent methyltransferase
MKANGFKNEFGEVWLNLGCGCHLLKNFINVDDSFSYKDMKERRGIWSQARVDDGPLKFVKSDIRKLPFPDDYADYIMCMYSIEHLPVRTIIPTLLEWKRVLKPTGELVIATINFDDVAREWLNRMKGSKVDVDEYWEMASTVYGLQISPGEFHRCPFNPEIMNFFINEAQFPHWEYKIYPQYNSFEPPKGYPSSGQEILKFSEIRIKAYKNSNEVVNAGSNKDNKE